MLTCTKPWKWGNGLQHQAEQELLRSVQHGVPADQAFNRAKAAVRAIGAQPILDALATRIPWKQLKTLRNQVKYQFLLPAELSAKVASSAGKGAVGRPKGGKKSQKVPTDRACRGLDTGSATGHGVPSWRTQIAFPCGAIPFWPAESSPATVMGSTPFAAPGLH